MITRKEGKWERRERGGWGRIKERKKGGEMRRQRKEGAHINLCNPGLCLRRVTFCDC